MGEDTEAVSRRVSRLLGVVRCMAVGEVDMRGERGGAVAGLVTLLQNKDTKVC